MDEQGWQHFLATGTDGYTVKVEKTRGGDYSVTAFHEDDPAGGEVDYRDTLSLAKKRAEEMVADGTWAQYTLDPDAASAGR